MEPSSFLRPRDVAKVSLSLFLPAVALASGVPVDPPEAPADRALPLPPPKVPALVAGVEPLEALAQQWEEQAAKLEDLSASLGGAPGVNLGVALLRENAAELRVVVERQQRGER